MTAVLVLGVARSGTSLAAGLLTALGADMGTPAAQTAAELAQNPRGSFEDRDFILLTSAMHRDLESGTAMADVEARHAATADLLCHRPRGPVWGWKSCLTHPFLPFFLRRVPDARLVVCWRDAEACARSLAVHRAALYGQALAAADALAEVRVRQAGLLAAVLAAGRPALWLTHAGLRSDPWRHALALAGFLGIDPAGREEAARAVVVPGYTTLAACDG